MDDGIEAIYLFYLSVQANNGMNKSIIIKLNNYGGLNIFAFISKYGVK